MPLSTVLLCLCHGSKLGTSRSQSRCLIDHPHAFPALPGLPTSPGLLLGLSPHYFLLLPFLKVTAVSQSKSCIPVTETSSWTVPTHISVHILHPCPLLSATGAIPKLLGSPKCFYISMHDRVQSTLRMFLLLEDYSSLLCLAYLNPGPLL